MQSQSNSPHESTQLILTERELEIAWYTDGINYYVSHTNYFCE